MRATLIVPLLCLLCACGSETDDAESIVALELVDPASAQFRNVVFYPNADAVCGEVNARNRMGGYAGFQRFYVANGKAVIEPAETVPLNDVDRLSAATDSAHFNINHTSICNDLPDRLRLEPLPD